MEPRSVSTRRFCILSGLSGVAGVTMLIVSFAINSGPPPDPGSDELLKFGQQTMPASCGEPGCRR